MSEFIVRLRKGGRLVLEGAGLSYVFREGSDLPLITIHDTGDHDLAIIPADAVEAVYRKDTEKDVEEPMAGVG